MARKSFDSVKMLKLRKTKVAKQIISCCKKQRKTIKIWDLDADNIIISKLIETRKFCA